MVDWCFAASARLKLKNERRLLQEWHEGTACGTPELLGVNRAVIVRVGSLEAFLDEREKLRYCSAWSTAGRWDPRDAGCLHRVVIFALTARFRVPAIIVSEG